MSAAQAPNSQRTNQQSPWNRFKRALLQAPMTLADGMARRSDNILWIRHLAAAMVIFSHSFALTILRPGDVDPLATLFPGLYSGIIAVYIFFIVSGVLVTTSHIRNRNTWRFAASRALRVAPAFWVCLLVIVFFFGPLFTSLSTHDYFSAAGTWGYLKHNVDFIALQWTLPGVFTGNPRGDVVNGSIWSLSLESRLYAYWILLALIAVLPTRRWYTLFAIGMLIISTAQWWAGEVDQNYYRSLTDVFIIGGLAAHWSSRVPISLRLLTLLVVALICAAGTRIYLAVAITTILYATACIAYRLPAIPFPRGRDWSYGIFLYGFPIQQALVALWPNLHPLELTAVALPLAWAFAALSWSLVEEPMLQFKPQARPL